MSDQSSRDCFTEPLAVSLHQPSRLRRHTGGRSAHGEDQGRAAHNSRPRAQAAQRHGETGRVIPGCFKGRPNL